MKLIIKNCRVINPADGSNEKRNIYIENGKISSVFNENDADILDGSSLTAAPGLIDMHCHLRDPGYEYKEDILTGTKSAAAGGFTSVACMPNTQPVADSAAVIEYIKNKAASSGCVNVYPIGAISKGLKGEELAETGELKLSGAVAVSDDGRPVENPGLMRKAMMYAKGFDMLVISHCEELKLVDGGVMNDGYYSTYLGLRGIPNSSEELMVAREILLCRETGARVHIAHVSTKGSVELIRRAKASGIKITCETCPHYFSLNESAVDGYDTNAKMNPPLRTEEDVAAIIEGIADGTIDAIATDHAPHHIDEKNVEFDKALNGIIGFETALSLGITYLVKPGHITLSSLIEKMSKSPADILHINKGTLNEGADADIVIFDENAEYTVNPQEFVSRSKNSPYGGYALTGRVIHTIVNGKFIVKNGRLI